MPAAHSPAANKSGHGRGLRVGIDADAAHDVMRRRPDLHRRCRDVEIRQLHELMIHGRQFLFDVLGGVRQLLFDPRDVEIDAAVWRAATGFDFAIDAAGDVIARQKFGRTVARLVALRVSPAFFFGIAPFDLCNCPGMSSNMNRLPSLFFKMPPSPRTPSVTRIPRTLGGQTIPVGWNWTNSISINSAPASYARAWPSPVPSQELM